MISAKNLKVGYEEKIIIDELDLNLEMSGSFLNESKKLIEVEKE